MKNLVPCINFLLECGLVNTGIRGRDIARIVARRWGWKINGLIFGKNDGELHRVSEGWLRGLCDGDPDGTKGSDGQYDGNLESIKLGNKLGTWDGIMLRKSDGLLLGKWLDDAGLSSADKPKQGNWEGFTRKSWCYIDPSWDGIVQGNSDGTNNGKKPKGRTLGRADEKWIRDHFTRKSWWQVTGGLRAWHIRQNKARIHRRPFTRKNRWQIVLDMLDGTELGKFNGTNLGNAVFIHSGSKTPGKWLVGGYFQLR